MALIGLNMTAHRRISVELLNSMVYMPNLNEIYGALAAFLCR